LIQPREKAEAAMDISHIVVALDFSEHSQQALRYASVLASAFGARVSLLHVLEDPFVTGAWSSTVLGDETTVARGILVSNAQLRLAREQRRLQREGHVVDTCVRPGHPAATIAAFAADRHADLVVMGTHGRTGLAHLMLGSVAERVMRTAPCPVLIVSAPPASTTVDAMVLSAWTAAAPAD
jgi:universal stress protein A